MSARFEVVRTAHEQWHARFVAANGQIVWVTENYRRKVGAEKAIRSVRKAITARVLGGTEVRYVDDRLKPMPRPPLPSPGSLNA